jgi:CPA1 family monovalent cation:H+ antiporter
MRGALSLAGALSIPLLARGHAFPGRDLIIFLVYVIVIGTLVLPSLGLEHLIRRLGLAEDLPLRQQEADARRRIIHAALLRLDELDQPGSAASQTIEQLRGVLDLRLTRIRALEPPPDAGAGNGPDDDDASVTRLRRELITAERAALAQLRADRAAPAEILARIQRDIDLDEARLHG